jgi:hypothetical protein
LQHHKQIVCYRYWLYKNTEGREGWDPSCAGSLYHLRSSEYLIKCFKEGRQSPDSAFRHCAKHMVTLADKLAQLRTPPPKPSEIPVNIELPSIAPTTPPPPAMPTLSSPTPGTPLRNVHTAAPPAGNAPAPMAANNNVNAAQNMPTLPCPVAYGRYRHFDYTNRRATDRMLIRMLVHGAIRRQDVSFDWPSSKVLEIKLAWPQWFTFAEQMAMLTADDEGKVQFPPEHPMTMDMSERNAELMKEDGNVYDYGYFTFERDMIQQIDTFELLNIPIEGAGVTVRMLQFYVEVATPSSGRNHQRVTHERTANLGTGRDGGGPLNARKASDRADEEEDTEDSENTTMSNNSTGAPGGLAGVFQRNVRGRM